MLSLVRNHMGVNWTEVEGFFHYSILLKQGSSWRSLSPTTWLVATTVSISNCAHLNEVRILWELCHCAVYSDGAFDCMSGQHLFQQIQQKMGKTRNLTTNSQRYSLNTEWLQHFCWQNLFTKDPWAFVC